MKCLFIGGPAAGKTIEVGVAKGNVRVPIMKPNQAAGHRDNINLYVFEFATYVRYCAIDKAGNRHILYVESSISDPLIELMNFYAEARHS